jgi:preprotein translocase subunit SecF
VAPARPGAKSQGGGARASRSKVAGASAGLGGGSLGGAPAPRRARERGGLLAAARRLYRGETNFDFINRWKWWFALSGTVIVVGMAALGVRGLNFSIDFRGGTVWQVPTTASVGTVRGDLAKVSPLLGGATITQLTSRQTGKVNIQVEAPAKLTGEPRLVSEVTTELAKIAHVPTSDVTLNAIGPSWGSDITHKAVEAVIVFIVLLFIAISVYFETKMAVAAIAAAVHDMLVTVGIYALSGFQVSPDTVIAFLTVLGYSLYDTIVVFDKVKENTKGLASTNRVTYTDVVNLSMNQVLARSINTSFVAVVPVFCILVIGSWVLGAAALNDFGLALFIGLVSGAYSSIFIASPILALLKEREPRYTEIRRRLAAYPQSRQVLTSATVAGGVVFAPRPSTLPPAGEALAGHGPGQGLPAPSLAVAAEAPRQVAPATASLAEPAAEPSASGNGDLGEGRGAAGNGAEEVGEDLAAGNGGEAGPLAAGQVAAPSRAQGTAGGRQGAPPRPGGSRALPPRARKKPRRR